MKFWQCAFLVNLVVLVLVLVTVAPAWSAPIGDGGTDGAQSVNKRCPVSEEPVVPSAGTVEHDGYAVGLCCPGCGRAFLGWDEARRDAFVAMALRDVETGAPPTGATSRPSERRPAASPPASDATGPTYPYPLDTCIVSGEKLGSMGKPVVLTHEGREVKLCCNGCVRQFDSRRDEFLAKLDEQIVKTQRMHYPIDTCIVSGSKLGSMGDPVDHVHDNRLVRFCCKGCVPRFEADPAKYLAALDRAIVEQYVATYPLDTCAVAGGKLGSMGKPVDHVYGNRLVRFCCGGCIKQFEAEPAKYFEQIDQAYADAQRASYPLDTCVVGGGKLGSMGEPDELVAGRTLVRFCCAGCRPAFEADPDGYLAKLKE